MRYEDPYCQTIIFNMIDRYIYNIETYDGNSRLVFEKTKQSMVQHLEVSLTTLKKYIDIWAKKKNTLYRFFDPKKDTLGNYKLWIHKKHQKKQSN